MRRAAVRADTSRVAAPIRCRTSQDTNVFPFCPLPLHQACSQRGAERAPAPLAIYSAVILVMLFHRRTVPPLGSCFHDEAQSLCLITEAHKKGSFFFSKLMGENNGESSPLFERYCSVKLEVNN